MRASADRGADGLQRLEPGEVRQSRLAAHHQGVELFIVRGLALPGPLYLAEGVALDGDLAGPEPGRHAAVEVPRRMAVQRGGLVVSVQRLPD